MRFLAHKAIDRIKTQQLAAPIDALRDDVQELWIADLIFARRFRFRAMTFRAFEAEIFRDLRRLLRGCVPRFPRFLLNLIELRKLARFQIVEIARSFFAPLFFDVLVFGIAIADRDVKLRSDVAEGDALKATLRDQDAILLALRFVVFLTVLRLQRAILDRDDFDLFLSHATFLRR